MRYSSTFATGWGRTRGTINCISALTSKYFSVFFLIFRRRSKIVPLELRSNYTFASGQLRQQERCEQFLQP